MLYEITGNIRQIQLVMSLNKRKYGEPYFNLYEAIVLQAMQDYVQAYKARMHGRFYSTKYGRGTEEEMEQFIRGAFPEQGDEVIRYLQRRAAL